jgi:hypothetical protein
MRFSCDGVSRVSIIILPPVDEPQQLSTSSSNVLESDKVKFSDFCRYSIRVPARRRTFLDSCCRCSKAWAWLGKLPISHACFPCETFPNNDNLATNMIMRCVLHTARQLCPDRSPTMPSNCASPEGHSQQISSLILSSCQLEH